MSFRHRDFFRPPAWPTPTLLRSATLFKRTKTSFLLAYYIFKIVPIILVSMGISRRETGGKQGTPKIIDMISSWLGLVLLASHGA